MQERAAAEAMYPIAALVLFFPDEVVIKYICTYIWHGRAPSHWQMLLKGELPSLKIGECTAIAAIRGLLWYSYSAISYRIEFAR